MALTQGIPSLVVIEALMVTKFPEHKTQPLVENYPIKSGCDAICDMQSTLVQFLLLLKPIETPLDVFRRNKLVLNWQNW